MSSPRYKLWETNSWDKRQAPGATKIDSKGRTWVLTPVGRWWTPQQRPSNCQDPSKPVCSWQSNMFGHGTTLHVEKGACIYCKIGNSSIGIYHPDGYLWYHGYIQHGWLEGD